MRRLTLALTLTLLACSGKHKATPPAPAPALTPAVVTLQVLGASYVSPLGTPLTLFASVTDGATGSVTFWDGADALGTAPVGGSAISYGASLTLEALETGPHALTAQYLGDTNYAGATSRPPQSETIVPTVQPTTFVLANAPSPAALGQAVTFTATVTYAGIATTLLTGIGTVTFTDGTTVLATQVALVNGVATLTVASLKGGSHTVTATYQPLLATVDAATSNAVTQVVGGS